MNPKLPHILLLITDQFRHDVVSPIITPNLVELQHSNGTTTFSHGYTSTPSCTPARAGLLTGKSPWSHGMLGYGHYTDCAQYPTTMARVLGDSGKYKTVAVGKNHFGPVKHIQGYEFETLYDGLSEYADDYDKWFEKETSGMDPKATCGINWNDWIACPYWYDEYVHPTAWTTRQAMGFLQDFFEDNQEQEDEHQPLLLKVSYHRPHSPYDPPRRIMNQYLPGGSKSNVPQLNRLVNDTSWDRRYRNVTMSRDAWAGDPGADAARHSRAGYLGNVEYVDENIGQILDYLRHQGVLEDFVIVWTSDHGDQNGDHYLWRKGYPWEASAHIQMTMKLPHSDQPPKISEAIVENRDIAPTLYDIVGVLDQAKQKDPAIDGKSLLSVLTGQEDEVRKWLDLEHDKVFLDSIHWNALVGYLLHPNCELWKYIFFSFDGTEQLFCLSNDPNEWNDLALDPAYEIALFTWRHRLVHQFEKEGRGQEWVLDGVLQLRKKSRIFGPNFPCKSHVRVAEAKSSS